jgi:hypothetical protein
VLDPTGKPLDVDYLETTFGGMFPFTNNKISLQKFSNGNTAVVPESHDQLLSVPEERATVGHLSQFFREKGKPLSDLTENIGSYRVWVGDDKSGHLSKINGEPDHAAQTALQEVLNRKQVTPLTQSTTPGGSDMESKEATGTTTTTSKGQQALSQVEDNLAKVTKGPEQKDHASKATAYKNNAKILSGVELGARTASVLLQWSQKS